MARLVHARQLPDQVVTIHCSSCPFHSPYCCSLTERVPPRRFRDESVAPDTAHIISQKVKGDGGSSLVVTTRWMSPVGGINS